MATISQKELDKLSGKLLRSHDVKKPHKYGAVGLECKLGHKHPSRAEAIHCWYLQAQLKTNSGAIDPRIIDLEYEKPYEIIVAGKLICVHKPDFTYKEWVSVHESTGQQAFVATHKYILCVDEVKGVKTADWVIKSKLFQALYPEIRYRVIQ